MITTQIKPVRTSVKEQKAIRNIEIIASYKSLMAIPGSQRTAVAEHIAAEKGMSYSNVIKITRNV